MIKNKPKKKERIERKERTLISLKVQKKMKITKLKMILKNVFMRMKGFSF